VEAAPIYELPSAIAQNEGNVVSQAALRILQLLLIL
jgi:hypothetical protein